MAAESQIHFDRDLDVQGLDCPLPILRTKQQLRDMQPGECLRVRATDPHSVIDFTGFCDRSPHALVDHRQADGVFTFWLRKGSD